MIRGNDEKNKEIRKNTRLNDELKREKLYT